MQYYTGATSLVGIGRVSGTILSDPLTSGGAWTNQSGTETYSGSGATFTSSGTLLTSANATTSPISGIPITAQVTFQTPSTVPLNMKVMLWQDASNNYELRWQNDNNLVLYKTIAGTTTAPAGSGGTPTESASTTYTFTLTLDSSGNLTGSLYSGAGTGGTLLKQLTGVDTSLSGPFHIGVGGDANVIASNAVLTGSIANPNLSSKPVEIKIPLWWADGTMVGLSGGAGSTTTSGNWFAADGGSFVTTKSALHTFSSKWPANTQIAFEASVSVDSPNTMYFALYDITSNSVVSSSQISTSSTTQVVVRSSKFTLTPGHSYTLTTWMSNPSYAVYYSDASLIVFP